MTENTEKIKWIARALEARAGKIASIYTHYGETPQTIKTCEELSECLAELTKDLMCTLEKSKLLRWDGRIELSQQTLEEIADALLMLVQISCIDTEQVYLTLERKINRTLEHIQKEAN
jgi:hypothetical protein